MSVIRDSRSQRMRRRQKIGQIVRVNLSSSRIIRFLHRRENLRRFYGMRSMSLDYDGFFFFNLKPLNKCVAGFRFPTVGRHNLHSTRRRADMIYGNPEPSVANHIGV